MELDYNVTYRQKDKGLQAIISYKINGRWKQKSKQGFENNKKGEKKAKAWVLKTLEELKSGLILNREYDNITFKEFIELYTNDRAPNLSYATLQLLKSTCEVNFYALNDIQLKNINTMDIQRCVNNMVNKLESSTIETYLSKIHTVFNFAMNKYNIISSNPVRNIEFVKTKPEEKKALTQREITSLLSELKKLRSKQYYISSLLAVKCGLRIGEILGLTWNDIDFTNNSISINKQWNKKNGIFTFKEPKTLNSYRDIPFSTNVKKELINFRNEVPLNIDNRLIRRKSTDSFSSELIRTYKKLGFYISVHELRHTYATNLIANGMDFKTAAKLLGHDIEQTMKTYSHVNSDMMDEARKIINIIS